MSVLGDVPYPGINNSPTPGWQDAIDGVNAGVPQFSDALPGRPGADGIETLPKPEILLQLRDQYADVQATLHAAIERRNDALIAKGTQEIALRRLTGPTSRDGHALLDDNPQVMAQKQKLEAATAVWKRANAHVEQQLAPRAAMLRNLVAACDDYALRHAGAHKAFAGNIPPPPKGEQPQATVERCRREIAGLRQAASKIAAAPLPANEAKARLREKITKLAAAGVPNINGLFRPDGDLHLATSNAQIPVFGFEQPGFAGGELVDAAALVAWMFRDTLLQMLDVRIDQAAANHEAMTIEEAARQQKAIAEQILALERQEVAAVEAGALAYRSDLDPRAVLHLA